MMTIGIQEILAIMIVAAIVVFALFRRMRKKPASKNTCSDCEHTPSQHTDEKSIRFFTKQR